MRATVFVCISFDPLQLVLTLICSAKNLNEIENENEIDLVSVSLLLSTIVYGGRARLHSILISKYVDSNCAESPNLIFKRIRLPLCTHTIEFFLSVVVAVVAAAFALSNR